jgi:hypothetical protein
MTEQHQVLLRKIPFKNSTVINAMIRHAHGNLRERHFEVIRNKKQVRFQPSEFAIKVTGNNPHSVTKTVNASINYCIEQFGGIVQLAKALEKSQVARDKAIVYFLEEVFR